MNERERELLSALMDGEVSEHEFRQALRATEADPALAAVWKRYHVAQSALRGDAGRFSGIDLRAAVADSIDAPEASPVPGAHAAGAGSSARRWLQPLASVAVAAVVAVVTVFAWQAGTPAPVAAGAAVAEVAATGDIHQHVALGPMVVVREDGEELVVPAAAPGSPTAGQDRLNAYFARHAQAAGSGSARGLAPYARVVSLEGEQGQ